MKTFLWVVMLILLPMTGMVHGAPPATQPALSSKPASKDGLQATVTLPRVTFAANEQPKFTVQFKNVSQKPFTLHDVDWFWHWTIRFEDEARKGPWELRLGAKVRRAAFSPDRICKPGETVEVTVDLGKADLPFDFAWHGEQAKSVAPITQLAPGKYRLAIDLPLTEGPVRADVAFWTGTLTTEPVAFEISDKPTTIPFDTHDGYFVSNKFEPMAPASFVVLQDQKAFDEVFGAGFVMNDKSHRLPANAFDTKIVLAAIKRGKAVVEFKVTEVMVDKGVLTVRYTTTSTKNDSAEFACPLIVSVPKGDFTAVEFVEEPKSVRGRIEIKAAASQPAAAFDTRCIKKADAMAVTTEADRTIFTITSPSGIGGATIERKGDSWPKQVVLRVHLRGLESLALACGDLKLSTSVASHSGNPRRLILWKNGKDDSPVTKDSPYWTEISAKDATGKTVSGLPDKDGYFEMVVPKALLDDKASKLTLGWIDFYR